MLESILRILALTRKELLAVLKDPRGRFTLFFPPILQCLIYGYVASYDLNDVPYAVLDQDRHAASRDLLAGSTARACSIASPAGAGGRMKTLIDQRRALLVIQIGQDFQRQLLAGQPADVQVIADGRNSNTAGIAIGYVGAIVDALQRPTGKPTTASRAADPGVHARLVQPESGNALEHDPQPDRHAHDDADAAADGHVGGPRAGAGDIRPIAGHALPPGRDHGRQGAAVDARRRGAGHQHPAGGAALVSHPLRRLVR